MVAAPAPPRPTPVARPAPPVAKSVHVRPAEPVRQAVPVPTPVRAVPTPVQAVPRGGVPVWLHLWPVVFLGIALSVPIVRDVFQKVEPPAPPVIEEATGPIDTTPRIAIKFHDREEDVTLSVGGSVKPADNAADRGETEQAIWEPSMRFGLVTQGAGPVKRLTYEDRGLTNNTVVRLDSREWIFGERPFRRKSDGKELSRAPGQWVQRENRDLGKDPAGRLREGCQSEWLYENEQVHVTQTVELVAGEQSRLFDTCLIRYLIENKDRQPHSVGLRFMLDTYIGANDGVPFTIPGDKELCDTSRQFNRPEEVPDFIQALEHGDLSNPGTIAHVQLKLGGRIEAPSRVTLGAWPNPDLSKQDPRFRQEKTLWDVPVLPIKTLSPADSAVTIYWNDKLLDAGAKREVGFAYGLGNVSSEGSGKLALTAGGSFRPSGEFTLTAYVNNPLPNQTLKLTLPEGFRLVEGELQQSVPPLPPNAASRNIPVTWRIRAGIQEGTFALKVESSNGLTQTQNITIRGSRLFD
jgi:hypothetical protein